MDVAKAAAGSAAAEIGSARLAREDWSMIGLHASIAREGGEEAREPGGSMASESGGGRDLRFEVIVVEIEGSLGVE